MKWLNVSPLLIMLAAVPAHGQWEPPNEVLQVRISGKGDWVVRCEYQDKKGQTVSREARGKTDRLHLGEPISGSCTYQAATDRPLTIWLKSPHYSCTLPTPQPKICRQVFTAGSSGRIEIRKRG
ncbi:MAG: hypothetical protein WC729_05085 [Sphingomonas sp.]|jgi:hypothetical protein|uniref:hypothetical protein n=1 Tax=Sphingomonas sp. TaxID=28214 RepID=UPI0035662BDA